MEEGVIDVVCGVIRDAEGAYLACRRPAGKHLGGLWEFPGGKVDAGESPEAALARELHEELAVHVEVGAALEPVEWHYEDVSIRLLPFVCVIPQGEPRAMEHEELCWVSVADFGGLEWAPADVPVLDCLRAGG